MAYYSSSYYYMDDHGEYNGDYSLNSYYNSYNSASFQDSMTYSSYSSNDYQIFAHDPFPISSRMAYFVSAPSEPKHIEYDLDPYCSSQTRFVVSYNISQFNEPDFEEYDLTPYGGGYDLAQTYGKPLPPSDEICYPRSASAPPTLPSTGVGSGPTTTPAAKVDVAEPQSESKPTARDHENDHDHGDSQEENLDSCEGEKSKESYGDEQGEIGYEYGKQVAEIPSGYGLEAMDICEGIFGYWPCLSRYGRRWADFEEGVADHDNYSNPWKETSDYLFGSPYPYGERRDDENNYGNAIYSSQRHYQQQSLYQQVEDSRS